MSRFFVKVFVSGPFSGPLTYCADAPIELGSRVKIPLAHREVIGIVQGADDGFHNLEELKSIIEILDKSPILTSADLELLSFAANYYQSPLGNVVLSSLPTALRRGRKIPKAKIVTGLNQSSTYELTKQQHHATERVRAMQNKFSCFLLQGVTGSGKTQIFTELIRSSIQRGKQVLLLVPEIGLTKQMQDRILAKLDGALAISHSGLADGARASAFVAASSGKAQVLIGTRSSLFTPEAMTAPGASAATAWLIEDSVTSD